MARTKQATPRHIDSSSSGTDFKNQDLNISNSSPNSATAAVKRRGIVNGVPQPQQKPRPAPAPEKQAGVIELVICAGGIYASFLSWALLQERITTTRYGPPAAPEVFDYSVFLNTIQSTFAFVVGYIYLLLSSPSTSQAPKIFPTTSILLPLLLVAVTSSLASPFGYASLKHVGYITFILAKSCKLLPVMALHVTVFRRSYPLYKYLVVLAVTAGVAVFTLYSAKKPKSHTTEGANPAWGLLLLAVNLLFDGLTNSTQDHINATFAPYSGAQMMCANNLLSTALTTSYLLLLPLAPAALTIPLVGAERTDELAAAIAFVQRNPQVLYDVLGFAACGAVGQIFIFRTLARFSSLLLVTITVTRKMLTMLLSVVWFGHHLSLGQWAGVGLVFGGLAAEAGIGQREKRRKKAAVERKGR